MSKIRKGIIQNKKYRLNNDNVEGISKKELTERERENEVRVRARDFRGTRATASIYKKTVPSSFP